MKTEKYRKGSIIFVEGNKNSDDFYILRQGVVGIKSDILDIKGIKEKRLSGGDLFGVISAMSEHPRLYSASALSDVEVLPIPRNQFPSLIRRNIDVAIKILGIYSHELRFLNRIVASDYVDSSVRLLETADYYSNLQDHGKARYIYTQFLKDYPGSPHSGKAKMKLDEIGGPLERAERKTGITPSQYSDGDVICSEGEKGTELYVIQEGKIKITKISNGRELTLSILGTGDIFGEMAILENEARSATAYCFGKTSLLVIGKETFQPLVEKKPDIATKIIQLLSKRIWTAYKQIESLSIKSPLTRVLHIFLTQLQKEKVNIPPHQAYICTFGLDELLVMVPNFDASKNQSLKQDLLDLKVFNEAEGKIILHDIDALVKELSFLLKREKLTKEKPSS